MVDGLLEARALLALLIALALDVSCGEPPNRFHPVAWFGSAAAKVVRVVSGRKPLLELAAGALIALGLPALATGLVLALVGQLRPWPWVELAISALLLKTTFAFRALGQAAGAVQRALNRDDLASARVALGSLCSRDGAQLDAPLVAAGAVESVAENASDSVLAPLFYYALFGLPGAVFYRAVNTLDAMIGYRGKYEYLGKTAARLDDLLNLVPARLTMLFLFLAGALRGRNVAHAFRVFRRDRRQTSSPNAGWPMAAMAGLLGVELEKRGEYRLGQGGAQPGAATIDEAWRITRWAVTLAFGACAGALGVSS